MEELGVSELYFDPFTDSGYSVMSLGTSWAKDTGGISWLNGSRESYFQAYLGGSMIED